MLAPGTRLAGRYRLVRRLGKGGMGEVWAAKNEAIERDVAVKVLLPDVANHKEMLDRFFTEAKVCGAIRHPGIVDVLDLGTSEDGLRRGGLQPACNRVSGNSSKNPNGKGCSAADLCASGWHVCTDREDVLHSSGNGSCQNAGGFFWATSQSTDAFSDDCTTAGSTNNVVGCGTLFKLAKPSCSPLTRVAYYANSGTTWYFGNVIDVENEAAVVTKSGPEDGGVLCCRNM